MITAATVSDPYSNIKRSFQTSWMMETSQKQEEEIFLVTFYTKKKIYVRNKHKILNVDEEEEEIFRQWVELTLAMNSLWNMFTILPWSSTAVAREAKNHTVLFRRACEGEFHKFLNIFIVSLMRHHSKSRFFLFIFILGWFYCLSRFNWAILFFFLIH